MRYKVLISLTLLLVGILTIYMWTNNLKLQRELEIAITKIDQFENKAGITLDDCISQNQHLDATVKELREKINSGFIFPYAIPTEIIPYIDGRASGPYDISRNKYIAMNGALELICRIYAISNKTYLENYKPDPDVIDKLNSTYIHLFYFGNKNIPFANEKEAEVNELILWYDEIQKEVMLSKVINGQYLTASLKGSYYSQEDVVDMIYYFIVASGRTIQ